MNKPKRTRSMLASILIGVAVIAAAGLYLYFLVSILSMAGEQEPIPWAVWALVIVSPIVTIAGVAIATVQRAKEVHKGELEDAKKY